MKSRLNIKRYYLNIYNFMNKMKENQLDIYAGAAAFFLFVSFIPFGMLLLSIVPYTPISDDDIYMALSVILPTKVDNIAFYIMNQLEEASIATLSISAIGAIWLSAWGIQSLKKGLNKIYGIENKKNFILLRLNAVIYTAVFFVSIIAIFIFNIFSNRIFEYIVSRLESHNLLHINNFIKDLYSLKFIIVIVLTFIISFVSFWAMPDKKMNFKAQLPGAIFVSIVWYVFSKLFNLYIDRYNAYSMYGSLSFMIIVLMWLYTSMYIFFIGAQINYYLSENVKKDKI